jgi:hypothetical protein
MQHLISGVRRMRSVLYWLYDRLRWPYSFLKGQHPNIIEFSAAFLGVLLAALIAFLVDRVDERYAENNLLDVMQYDYRHVLKAVNETRNTILLHLGLEGEQENVWNAILEKLEVNPQSVIPTEEIFAKSDEIPNLSKFDRRVFNGALLPQIMIQVLTNNIRLYRDMRKLTYTGVLEWLPLMTGSHVGYNALINEAIALDNANKQSVSGIKAISETIDTRERTRFEMILMFNKRDYQINMRQLIIEAIRALDDYHDRLFRICHFLEYEWRRRECGLSEKELYAIHEQPTLHLANELSCTTSSPD